MKVTFRSTLADRVAFLWIHLTRSKGLLLLIGGMALLLSWNTCRGVTGDYDRIVRVIVWLILAVLIFAFLSLFAFVGTAILLLSRRNKTLLTDTSIELQDDGFLTETRYGRSECRWAIVQGVVQTRWHIVLYTTASGGIVVPRRAFQGDQDWDAFCRHVHAHAKG